MSGQKCTGPSTEICIVTSCMASNLAASLGATVTMSSVYSSDFVAAKAIDGNPKDVTGQTLDGYDCAATTSSSNPWLRVDLQMEYLVSRVRAILIDDKGENVYVHVGNSITNNGNDNHNCGKAPYDSSNHLDAIWRDVSCHPPVWGRYINLQRIVTNHILHVCEVAFNYELEIAILDNNTNIVGTSVAVDENQDYSNPIDCGVSPDVTNFNALMQWKHNTTIDVPSLSVQTAGVRQMYEKGVQKLYIKSASVSDSGVYTCQYSATNGSIVSKSFTLNVNVDCIWGSWSSCSVECGNGTRTRQMSGQKCTGPSTEICIVTSCMASNLPASLGATVTMSSVYSSDFVAAKAIDGNPKDVTGQTLDGYDCAATTSSSNPWLRVDLQMEYLVSRVRAILIDDKGENVYVHVGNSITNNGNDNHNCGKAPYDSSNHLDAIWRDVSCHPPVWGRYINLQRIVTNHILHVCEVAFNYELEIAILDNNTNIVGTSVAVDENQDYSNPIDCGVSPDVTNFNALMQWKHNTTNDVPSLSVQTAGVRQMYEKGVQKLYIKSASVSDSGVYTCQYSATNGSIVSKSFTLNVNVDCIWGSWSSCSVECRNGTRTRQMSGQKCTGPSTEICIVTSCMASNLAASLGATVTMSSVFSSDFVAAKAIDGNPKDVTGQTLDGYDCAATTSSSNPWLRVDLQMEYLVSRVRAILIDDKGENVYVHVGNSITNNGNDNHDCGKAPYDSSNHLDAIWRDVSCHPPVWGRYINLQRIVTNHILHVCEVAFNYELEIAILDNNTNIVGTSVAVDENQDYSNPIDCGVSPDVTNFNALMQWKHNTTNDVPSLSVQTAGVRQMYEKGVQKLYIKSASVSDSGVYTCQYSATNGSIVSKSFTLNVNVNCEWSSWSDCTSSCSFGTRTRARLKQHNGMDCVGSPTENCDSKQAPCVPTIGQSTNVSFDESSVQELSCIASQYSGLSGDIKFGWYREENGVDLAIVLDSRVAKSLNNDGVGRFTGKLKFASVKRSDRGLIKCRAFNKYGASDLSSATSVNVKYAPEFVEIRPSYPVGVKGQSITLNCFAGGNPSPVYEWRGGKSAKTGSTLELTSLEFEDEGTYTCVASNTIEAGARSSNASVQLSIEGPPQRCVVLSVESYIESEVNVTVNCPENGNSSVTEYRIEYQLDSGTSNMQWLQREFSASDSQPFVVVGLSPFTKYRCRATARNRHGYEPGSFAAVNVLPVTTAEGYPGSPNSVSLSGNASARWFVVSWLPPSIPNGVPRYYFVYYKPISVGQVRDVDSQKRLTVTDTWANLTMLTPFTQYSVEVAAVNVRSHDSKVLEGQRSTAIVVNTTEDAPTPPLHVRNSSVTSNSVTLQWDSPINSNGILLFYTVYYSTGASQYDKSSDISISQSVYALMNLNPYTTYFIYMSVTNNANFNPESSPSNVIQVRTLLSLPLKPDKPLAGETRPSATTITLVPPSVDDSNGPIKYVDFIVHEDVTGSDGDEAANIPSVIRPYDKSRIWYVAARYEYDHYKKNIGGHQFIIGNGTVVSAGGTEYTNGPLQPGQSYLVYIRVIGIGDNRVQEFSSVSKAIRYTTASSDNESENKSSSGESSNSVLIIAVTVTLSVIILVLIIILIVFLRKNYRCARKEITLEPTKYDSIVTNSKATSGTGQCLGKNNEIMTINMVYTTTGAGSSAASYAYEEVGTTADQNNIKNEEPLYESMDGESAL